MKFASSHSAKACFLIFAAAVWPVQANAISMATNGQMMCIPSGFVVATVVENIAARADEPCANSFVCRGNLYVVIRTDEAFPGRGDAPAMGAPTRGQKTQITLRIGKYSTAKSVAPGPQGTLTAPLVLERSEIYKAIAQKNFIFGIVGYDPKKEIFDAQIWPLDARPMIEKDRADCMSRVRAQQ